ncbi:protein-export membrane protein SecF [Anoxybacter fermentans]|uniref:Protein-export membrane protein SecF n=1 Tax=Anoxybacter fermentans TaxID=1323375 RepID=A0A3Q9HRU9_9FIRM|nr:protein translocase subunit SecF [Anoxybacter fermentans]AZR73096.1 protein-export membrane protein SecF [Anoxybacter fermentans]
MDFINKRRIWYTISLVVIGLGLISILFQGLNLGIDFVGGTIIEFKFNENTTVTTADIREILGQFGLEKTSSVVKTHNPEGFFIRTKELTPAEVLEIEKAIKAKYPEAERLKVEHVGPTIGKELRIKALLALLVASIAIVAYISLRFQFKYAIAAIVALLHDVAVVIGLFSIFRLEINTPFVAAILTIVGYSINDTIVIFDRIRENVKFMRKRPLEEICNKAIWDTLPRSINTSLTTLFTVLAILFFGGTSIKVFMQALLFGVLAGTYSSIFVAAPLLVTWKNWVVKGERI